MAYETQYDRMNRKNREAKNIRDIRDADRAAIGRVAPGAPYYQPEDEEARRALTRAKAQGEYMRREAGPTYQQDEGFLADTVRTAKNVLAGKRGRDAIEYGDPSLMAGARKAGREAVQQEASDEMRRESRGMKKGGSVSKASSRADGIAMRGKTRGKMV